MEATTRTAGAAATATQALIPDLGTTAVSRRPAVTIARRRTTREDTTRYVLFLSTSLHLELELMSCSPFKGNIRVPVIVSVYNDKFQSIFNLIGWLTIEP